MKRLVIFSLTSLIAIWALTACRTAEPPIEVSTQIDETAIIEASDAQLEAGSAVFTIVPEESVARFELDEDLRSAMTGWALGARITVVGTVDQISGELELDPTDLSTAQFSEIQIDARTFYTNEFMRTSMMKRFILSTETYPFITFTPTDITGLPDSIQIGETATFNIIGDLTIREMTHSETFEVTAQFSSPTTITGTASTVIPYEKYGLAIPDVPNISDVEEDVELYLDFVARSQ